MNDEVTLEPVDPRGETTIQPSVPSILTDCLDWAQSRGYAGYDPYDALNSPLLDRLTPHWFLRLVAIHGVKQFPINLRPILGVPRERNPKGVALFIRTYLTLYDATGDSDYLREAESLLSWLRDQQSPAFDKPSWGYNFDWQMWRDRMLPAHHPSLVVTVFCADAFLRHYAITGDEESLEIAKGAAEFIRTEINTAEFNGHIAYAYTPYFSFVAINANALAAKFFYDLSTLEPVEGVRNRAEELFDFIVATQDRKGAWYYAHPPDDSHLTHDNFHTGFVLESLHDYAMDRGPESPAHNAYERGMTFYRERLFEESGAPKFEFDEPYPYDVHSVAQAVITFLQRGRPADIDHAETVLSWGIEELYDDAGYFYRRQGRHVKDTTPYMRWSQAWMCTALAEVVARTGTDSAGIDLAAFD